MAACPRCKGDLDTISETPMVLGCRACESAFLDNDASQALIDDAVPAPLRQTYVMASGVVAPRTEAGPEVPFRSAADTGAPCPICRHAMRQLEAQGVHLDICAAHGTWLDRGEAELLRKAYAFQRASEAAAEAQIVSRREASVREVAETELRRLPTTGPHRYEFALIEWFKTLLR